MSGFQQPITINQALERINHNEFLLPAFQREFVWSANQIEQLFDSLMKGYPISSMLLWRVKGETKGEFKFYKFLREYRQWYNIHNESVSTDSLNDFHAVLDGQQRLTSLYIGLQGSYAYKEYRKAWANTELSLPTRILYLNISKIKDVENEIYYNFLFLKKEETGEKDLILKDEHKWFRVGRIISLHKEDYDLDEFCDDNEITKEEKKILRRLEKVVFTDAIINYYEEDEQKADKAVNIFIRINSGGTHLSFSDILMSVAVANWKNKDARTEIHNLVDAIRAKDFNIDKDYILKSFLYLYHKDVRFKIDSFNADFTFIIENNWERIRNTILSLFDLLKSFGMNSYTLTANNATLPILYYLYHQNLSIDFTNKKEYEEDRRLIKKWLLVVLLRRVFGSQTDTVLSQTRRAFSNDLSVSKVDKSITSFPSSEINLEIKKYTDIGDDYIEELLQSQKDSQYCFSILSLLYPNLDYKNNNFHKDHLHPASKYELLSQENKDKYGWVIYNSILNIQMLDANENMSKGDLDLKDWVAKETKSKDYKSFMDNHIIPDTDLSLNNFSDFIDQRRKMLIHRLRDLLK